MTFMDARWRYQLRGLAYWAECANPFRSTVTARTLPMGLRLRGYKRDLVGRLLYCGCGYEPGLTRLLLETFSGAPGANFIDVGANLGYFTCLMAKLAAPGGRVVAIEPDPANRRLLEHNVIRNRLANVVVHGCAAGAREGVARMGIYKPANRGRHSLIDLESCREFREVPVRRLDDLLRDAPVSSWALMKVDVEGYESLVFEGAEETLARTEMLAVEYSVLWKRSGVEPAAVFRKLAATFPRLYRYEGTDLVPADAAECIRRDVSMDLLLCR